VNPRVRSDLLVASLIAQVQGEGGFGAVLRRGDRERGDVLLVLIERGEPQVVLGRQMDANGIYSWSRLTAPDSAGSVSIAQLVAARERFDPDIWVLELDVADSQRFIAERLND